MPEKQDVEWKELWKDEYLEWICGFANARGGRLYIGCNDRGEVVGLADAKKLLEILPNKVRDKLGIMVDVNLYREGTLDYIEIVVPAYPLGISYRGRYYYRTGSTRQILDGVALEEFLMRRRGITWDNLPLPTFTVGDVDATAVDRFRSLAVTKDRIDASVLDESQEALLEKLHLLNGDCLINAAMLLFSRDPERYQLGAYIKIGFFDTDADIRYQDEIHGPLIEQVERAIELIRLKYMKAMITYEGIQRRERYFVPEAALREALLNAVCHKRYQSGVPIQVSVYEDRLYIANCGELPENWTVDSLMEKHVSQPYNPNIAHVFYLAGLVESWGRGVEKICNACRDAGAPPPEYTVHPGDIMIKFTAGRARANGVTDRVTEKVTDRVTNNVTENELAVLRLISEDPGYTMLAIANKLSISRKTVAARIKSLKEKGLLRRLGSARSGHWEIIG